jgi:hypothetical protein
MQKRRVIAPDHRDDVACRTQRRDVARHIAGTADHLLGRGRIDDRGGSLGRYARHRAVDESVEHDVPDHQQTLVAEKVENVLE